MISSMISGMMGDGHLKEGMEKFDLGCKFRRVGVQEKMKH